MTRLRVLLSEASILMTREHLTVLGTAGVRMEAMSSDSFAFARLLDELGAPQPRWWPVEPPDTYDLLALPAAADSACPTRLAGAQSWNCPAGGGWRVGGGASWAAVLVLLPTAVRGAAAIRAAPYRAD